MEEQILDFGMWRSYTYNGIKFAVEHDGPHVRLLLDPNTYKALGDDGLRAIMKFVEERQREQESKMQARLERMKNNHLPAFMSPEKKKSKSHGYVYLIKGDRGYYKIGKTVDISSRAKTFGVQLPFEITFEHTIETNNMKKLEAELHHRFSDKRINGEWFALGPEDVEYIRGL